MPWNRLGHESNAIEAIYGAIKSILGRPTMGDCARGSDMTGYVMLCRHGQHENGTLTPTRTGGPYQIAAVGSRLAEELGRSSPPGRGPINLTSAHCAESPEARETLGRLLAAAKIALPVGSNRTPVNVNGDSVDIAQALTSAPDQTPHEVKTLAKGLAELAKDDTAVLLVGHQPQLSRLADELLRRGKRRWPPLIATPIDHSGIVCIAIEEKRRCATWIAWAISFDDAAAADAVREKISRKMDTARTFGGLLTLSLTVILGVLFDVAKFRDLGDRQWAVQISGAIYLIAAILFLSAMYAYDSLLMPQRFWGETPAGKGASQRRRRWLVERPPSSSAWVLYQNMMRIWSLRFTAAVVLVGIATSLVGYAALRIKLWVLLPAAVVLVLSLVWWLARTRPVLGSND